MVYRLSEQGASTVLTVLGVAFDARSAPPWFVFARVLAAGLAALRAAARRRRRALGRDPARTAGEGAHDDERASNCATVHKSFGTTEIIHGVSLAIREGERHAIIGPNGAGKSHAVQPDLRPLPGVRRARSC